MKRKMESYDISNQDIDLLDLTTQQNQLINQQCNDDIDTEEDDTEENELQLFLDDTLEESGQQEDHVAQTQKNAAIYEATPGAVQDDIQNIEIEFNEYLDLKYVITYKIYNQEEMRVVKSEYEQQDKIILADDRNLKDLIEMEFPENQVIDNLIPVKSNKQEYKVELDGGDGVLVGPLYVEGWLNTKTQYVYFPGPQEQLLKCKRNHFIALGGKKKWNGTMNALNTNFKKGKNLKLSEFVKENPHLFQNPPHTKKQKKDATSSKKEKPRIPHAIVNLATTASPPQMQQQQQYQSQQDEKLLQEQQIQSLLVSKFQIQRQDLQPQQKNVQLKKQAQTYQKNIGNGQPKIKQMVQASQENAQLQNKQSEAQKNLGRPSSPKIWSQNLLIDSSNSKQVELPGNFSKQNLMCEIKSIMQSDDLGSSQNIGKILYEKFGSCVEDVVYCAEHGTFRWARHEQFTFYCPMCQDMILQLQHNIKKAEQRIEIATREVEQNEELAKSKKFSAAKIQELIDEKQKDIRNLKKQVWRREYAVKNLSSKKADFEKQANEVPQKNQEWLQQQQQSKIEIEEFQQQIRNYDLTATRSFDFE